jgi:hypothetical protein
VWQLDVRRDPPRLVFAEQLAPPIGALAHSHIDVGKLPAVRLRTMKQFWRDLGRPWRWEAA